MEISFRPITIKDKELITSFTLPSDNRNCDYSFSNICSWRFLYDTEFAVVDKMLLIRFWIENKTKMVYMAPTEQIDLKHAIELLETDAKKNGRELCMLGVTPEAKIRLEEAMPGSFIYLSDRDYFDYIYLREDLATLRGKKYQAKRNHVNNFVKTYPYKYIEITPELVPECLQLESKWFKANSGGDDEQELNDERRSMIYALNHCEELGLRGGAICVNHQIVAFSFGAPITYNTFGVHVEKADINYEGSYAIINKEFAAHLPEQYIYVNREEDLGIEGLRKAKLSYQPTILLEKSAAIKKLII